MQKAPMQPIINNLKYYNSPWHRYTHSNPFDTSSNFQAQYFLGKSKKIRTTLPRTQSISRSHLHGTKSRSKYFQEMEQSIYSRSNAKVEVKRKLFKDSDTLQSCDRKTSSNAQTTPDRKRNRIFGDDRGTPRFRFERRKNSESVKQSASKMKINELFFCEKCYLYLFKMELDYHYPDCLSDLNKTKLSKEQVRVIGQSKLDKLEYAVRYTNFKDKQQIIDIIKRIKDKKYTSKHLSPESSKGGLLSLSDAQVAVALIFNRFFR